MNMRKAALLWAICCVVVPLAGCEPASTDAEEPGFVQGAFPPTLSDTEHHQSAWSRKTCLSCHEHELDDAPKIRHESLTPEAKMAKCRTCHVLIPESRPR